MAAASLLTRLEHAADPNNTERYTWRDDDLEAAVIYHLAKMLNTRQGSSLTCPDYGVPEISETLHDLPEAIGIMQRAIKYSIATYEPRIKNVQVRHAKGESGANMLTLEFEVTGQLVHEDGTKSAIKFSTSVDGNGNMAMNA